MRRRKLTPLVEDRALDGDAGEDRGRGGKDGKEFEHGDGGVESGRYGVVAGMGCGE